MRHLRWLPAALAAAVLIHGCGGDDGGPDCDPIAAALVERVEVTPNAGTVQLGDSLQLTARAYSCEGPLSGLPPFEWRSGNAAALSVSSTGLVKALQANGTVAVTATVQGKTGTANIATALVPVATVQVTPATASVGLGRTSTLTARLLDAQGRELTGRTVTWSSSNTNVVTVTGTGQITGVTVGGPVTVTATAEGRSGSSAVTVVQNAVASVTVAPTTASIGGGATQQFTATLRDDLGNVLTGRAVNWTSSDELVATISGTGVATARRPGTTTITATSEGRSGTATLTVTLGPPTRLGWVDQPANVLLNAALPAVSVELLDAGGNRVPSSGVDVTVSATPNAPLGGTTTVNTVNGVATFTGLTVGAAGTFSLVASASGLTSATSNAFIVSVPAVTVTTTTLPTATRGTPYSQQLAATGGTGTFTWTVVGGTLPNGVSLSPSGLLNGTPTVAGTSNFTVRATSGGQSDDQALSLVVNNPGVQVTTTTIPAGTRGTAYSTTLAATGGDGQYAWSLRPGSDLPNGVTLSAAGVLSGTPTEAGTFSVIVRATSAGQSDDQTLSLVINNPAVVVTTTTIPGATQGAPYSTTLAATGGTGTYTWSVVAGALPTGVTLSTAGVLSGTPTASGAFNFTVRATSGAQSDDQALALTVALPAVTVTTTTVPAATRGSPYSTTLAATGGTGTYTWTVVTGTLPTGVTLSSAGTLSGTPSVAGTFNFTVRATSGAQSDDQALTLTVSNPGVQVSTTTLPGATQGIAYSTTLAATGGDGTYAWTLAAGNLPGGINLLNSGVLSGTPTQSGSFPITVRVTSDGVSDEQALTLAVAPPPGVRLGFVTVPTTGTAGSALVPAVQVEVLDASDARVTTSTAPVTLEIGTNGGGGTLAGGGPVNAVNGVATFANVTISAAGNGYTLVASSGSLQSATSAAIDIVAAGTGTTPTTLAFLQQPTNVDAGAVITPAVTVEVRNADGVRVPDATTPVTIAISTNPGGGTLSGTLTRTPVNGVVTFNDLRISQPATGYRLTASATGLTSTGPSVTFRVR